MTLPEGLQLTPFDETFHADPYAVYAALRTEAPLHRETTSFYPGETWTATGWPIVERLLNDPRLSVDARRIGMARDGRADNAVTQRAPDMMNLDGADHARLRSAVRSAFTPSSVAALAPRIEAIFDDCIQSAETERTRFDVVPHLAKPLPTIVIAEYIGVDASRHVDFKHWTDELLLQGLPLPTEDQWARIVAADGALRDYVHGLIDVRTREPENDLVTRLIAEPRLSADEVVDMCCLLIGAGNFTTTDLISNALLSLLQHGGADDAPVEDLVEEALRFDAPVLSLRRFATEDVEIDGATIPAGSVVNLVLGAAGHDAAVFNEPTLFDPSRSPNPHLAFGRGVHHCLGAPLARLEAQVVLRRFCERFPDAQLVDHARTRRMGFRGCKRLIVDLGEAR